MDEHDVIVQLSPPPTIVDNSNTIAEIELRDREFQNFDFNSFHETLVNEQNHEERNILVAHSKADTPCHKQLLVFLLRTSLLDTLFD